MTLSVAATVAADDWVNQVAWAENGGVYAACADGAVLSVDERHSALEHRWRHDGSATSLAVSTSGALASGGHDGAVRLDGGVVAFDGSAWVERVAWRPDGQRLAVAVGRQVHFLEPDGTSAARSRPFDATVTCLGWHPRGVNVIAGSYGGVQLILGRDGGDDARLPWKGSVLELAISPDGKRVAHGNQDATVHFWDIARRHELHMWGYATKVRELSWRRDSRYLATGGGTTVTIWDFAGKGPEGSTPIDLDHHDSLISALAFQQDGPLLLSAGDDGLLVIWHPGSGTDPVAEASFDEPLTSAAWSRDGQSIVVGGADGLIGVCRVVQR